jgi:SpoU rRNA methylase family enzyme
MTTVVTRDTIRVLSQLREAAAVEGIPDAVRLCLSACSR